MAAKSTLKYALAVLLFSSHADATEVGRFFGHDIRISGEYPDLSLDIDGQSVLKDAIITLSEVSLVDGVPALIGERSAGGNACDGSPFIVSFPLNAAPRLDGPIDSCSTVTVDVRQERLDFHTKPFPGRDGENWSWTPSDGLKALNSTVFAPDPNKGWANLRERKLEHPVNVFEYGEIAKQLDELLAADKANFETIIVGVGNGKFNGDDYVGTSCAAHMCTSTGALIYLSAADRKVYVAWKPDGGKIVVRPEVKQWPSKPRLELKEWAEKWK